MSSYGQSPAVTRPAKEKDIEVEPGRFLTIKKSDKHVDEQHQGLKGLLQTLKEDILSDDPSEWTELWIPWNGVTIHWKGVPIPFTLRPWEGTMYMIAFDRDSRRNSKTHQVDCILRFYKQKGDAFVEIKAEEFPKRIATQNMWIKDPRDIELTRKLDPRQRYFGHTLTAQLWAQLLTGKEYYQLPAGSVDEDQSVEFYEKYHPIPLPTIVRDDKKASQTNPTTNEPTK